jgi:methylglyoxal synthase
VGAAPDTTASITAAALTATGTAADKVYDATTAATVTISLSGVLGDDQVTGSATGTFDNKNVGTGKTVTISTVTLGGADAANYSVGAAPDTTASITAAALTATGTAADKVYDATTAATVTISLSGVLGDDQVTGSATGTFDNKNVGTGKTVTISTVTLGGADAANYSVSAAPDTTASITAAALTATGTAADKVYDATTAATVTISLSGVLGDDQVTGSATGTFDNKNVGTGKTVTISTVTLGGADAANYSVGAAPDTTASITAAALQVMANSASKTFGTADPPLTFVASGFVGDETAATALTGTLTREPGEEVGNYEILQGTLAAVNGNYNIAFTGANFEILEAPINDTSTVVVSSVNPSTYGEGVYFTATVSSDSGTPSGTVQFIVSGSNLGDAVPLVDGTAQSILVSTLTAGTHWG